MTKRKVKADSDFYSEEVRPQIADLILQLNLAEAKKLLESFSWNYVVLADEAQDDEFYAEARAGLEQQEKKLKEIAKSS